MVWGFFRWIMDQHVVVGKVGFDADEGVDARFVAGSVEGQYVGQGAVIGDGQGGHVEVFGLGCKRSYFAHAIEEAEFGVYVQVDEWLVHSRVLGNEVYYGAAVAVDRL